LVYADRVRHSILLACLLAVGMAAPALGTEQTIEQLAPPQEQRVEPVGQADGLARVDPVAPTAGQDVAPHVPPGPAEKAASRAGKVVLSIASAALALGVMVASLLLL
jgi:hypothetical protein